MQKHYVMLKEIFQINKLKSIAESGGVVGLNGFSEFVSHDKNKQNLEGFVDHIDYMADLIGIDHICLGFDYCDYLEKAIRFLHSQKM